MADQNDFGAEQRSTAQWPDQADEIWPGSGLTIPGWNPDGVFGGLRDLRSATSSLGLLFPDGKESTADRAPVTVTNPESLSGSERMPDFSKSTAGSLPDREMPAPSPGAATVYRWGDNIGRLGGRTMTYGAGLALATAPGLATPITAPAAVAGMGAGGVGVLLGDLASTAGTGLQLGAGLDIGLETGNWRPLLAAGAPVIAGMKAPLPPLIRGPLEDRLQQAIGGDDPLR